MTSKKVLVICLDMDPMSVQGDQHTGAAHLYVKETLEALGDAGIETLAITRLNDPEKPRTQKVSSSVRLVRIQMGEPKIEPKQYFWGKEDLTLQKIDQALLDLDFKPDLIHSIYWYSGKVGIQLSERFSVPHAYTIISLGKVKHQALGLKLKPHDIDREKTEHEMFLKSSVIISVCDQEKAALLRLYSGVEPHKIVVVGRGVDPALFSPRAMQEALFPTISKPYLFFAGRLIPSKGLPFLMQVCDRLLQDETLFTMPQLIIAGGTPEEVEESQSRTLTSPGLKKAHQKGLINWLGIVPRKQMPILYSNATLTCLPSIYDPAARVILESMACGTPLIMTETGYAEEVVRSGLNGYVAPYGDEKLWASHIKAVLSNSPWRKKLEARTRTSVIPYFSLTSFKERHLQAYQKVWSNDDHALKFHNPALSSIEAIAPHWDVPEADSPHISIEDIQAWCRTLGLRGDVVELPVQHIASSRIFSLEAPSGTYIIKQPRPKLPFYAMFYPTAHDGEDAYKKPAARWQTEQAFSKPPLFKKPVAVHEDLLLILSEKYTQKEIDWDALKVQTFFQTVRQFQQEQTSRFKDVIQTWSMPQKAASSWDFFRDYDQRINQLNAHFRGGGLWFTPAHAEIELQRFKLIFKSDLLPLSSGTLTVLERQHQDLLDRLKGLRSPASIIWGGCRTQHAIQSGDRLYGIDAESCCFGQPEIDFAQFLWWWMGLRQDAADEGKMAVMKDVLTSMTDKERTYTLAWIWLTNLCWLWWDLARSRKDRIDSFISFFTTFQTLLNEVC